MGKRAPLATVAVLAAQLSLLGVLSVAGCGGDDDGPDPAELEGARLEFVSPRTQSLRYDDAADLRVRYVFADGRPVHGAVIEYRVEGFAADATLAARQADTGADGEVNVPVTAGRSTVSFGVVVTPPVGDSVTFQIAVADFDAGSVSVELGYMGARRFTALEAFLFDERSCGDLVPDALPTALFAGAPVTRLTDRPGFVPVPVGTGYAVAVVARVAGAVEGFGCTGDVEVEVGKETIVPVDILDVDQPILIEGPYDLDSVLDFGGLLPPSVETAVEVLAELTDDQDVMGNAATMDFGQDPGAFIVDFAMRQTCAWECRMGEDASTCSEINHPMGDISAIYLQSFRTWDGAQSRLAFGGCGAWEDALVPAQDLVNDQITAVVPTALTAFLTVAGDLARAIDRARIVSTLTLAPAVDGQAGFTHELRRMDVVLHDLSGAEHVVELDLRAAGLSSIPRADAVAMLSGRRLDLAEHTFALEWGRLLQHVYRRGLLPLLGYASSAEMLHDWVDCAAVGRTLATSVGVLSEAQYTDACNAGLDLGGGVLDEVGISGLIDAAGTLTLVGLADAASIDAAGVAQALASGEWAGTWGEGGETGAVTGTFTGVRR